MDIGQTQRQLAAREEEPLEAGRVSQAWGRGVVFRPPPAAGPQLVASSSASPAAFTQPRSSSAGSRRRTGPGRIPAATEQSGSNSITS